MPYIKQNKRSIIDLQVEHLIKAICAAADTLDEVDGNANYAITKIIYGLYSEGGYAVKANALKTLLAVALEYYRRIMAPYEDQKRDENGEVYL